MRNLTAGDWFRLEALVLEAEEGDGAVEVDGVEGLDDVEGVGDGWVEDADDEGLDKELVSELLLALVSPVVWFSLLLSMGSGGREWWLPRPRSVRRKLWYLESEKNRKTISIKRVQRNCTALRRMIHEGESPEEGDWKHRGRVVSARVGLAIRRSRVQVPVWPLAGFVLGRSKFKSSATLVNSQLVAFCQLGF